MAGFNWKGDEAVRIAVQAGMDALYRGANQILEESINEANIETGTLRRSGVVTKGGNMDVYISYNTPYAVAVHEGYDAFEVTVKNKKVLAVPANKWRGKTPAPYNSRELPKWSKDGRFVILGKRTFNKGYKGNPFLRVPFQRNSGRVLRMAQAAIDAALAFGGGGK